MTTTNNLYQVVAEYVFSEQPFTIFNNYYIAMTKKKQLYDDNHLSWINYLLDKYLQYHSSGFNSTECELNSLMDGLEALINQAE